MPVIKLHQIFLHAANKTCSTGKRTDGRGQKIAITENLSYDKYMAFPVAMPTFFQP